ncbi:MAG: hypothetical protein LBK76_08600 [Verrucomicrobiales bacterium]|jgi:hypothetical protein|nr:hypothetical protein [Verrucomicrobiales bacterium]
MKLRRELGWYWKFYWHADDRWPLGLALIFAIFYAAVLLLCYLTDGWAAARLALLVLPFSCLLLWPSCDDADRQRVLPCAEFMLTRPVHRRRLYYSRLLLVGLYVLPGVLLGGAVPVAQPHWELTADTVSEQQLNAYRQHFPGTALTVSDATPLTIPKQRAVLRNVVRVPWGNVYAAGMVASCGLLLLLFMQGLLLLPWPRKFYQYAPMVAWVIYLIIFNGKPSGQPGALDLQFFFADWWRLLLPALLVTAALTQWLVCRRLTRLEC